MITLRKTLNHSYSGGPRGDSRKFYPNNITMHFVGWRNRNSSLGIGFAFRRVSKLMEILTQDNYYTRLDWNTPQFPNIH